MDDIQEMQFADGLHRILAIMAAWQGPQSEPLQFRSVGEFAEFIDYMIENPPIIPIAVLITPELAEFLLSERFGTQRRLNERTIFRITQFMRGGRFYRIGETLAIDTLGRLDDGQHRMHGVKRSEASYVFNIQFGTDPRGQDVREFNNNRTAEDALTRHGVKNGRTLRSIVRLIHMAETLLEDSREIDSTFVLYMLQQRPEIRAHASLKHRYTETGWGCPTVLMAMHHAFARVAGEARAREFMDALVEGRGRDANDPVVRLRRVLQKAPQEAIKGKRMSQTTKMALMVKAWNAWRRGSQLRELTWRTQSRPDEPFPRII